MAGAPVPRRRVFTLIATVVAIVFATSLVQLLPKLPNPPVTADLQAPADVKQILRTSCYNCHSNETKLSWFDEILPAYWLVEHDVRTARMHMNFSEFSNLPDAKQKAFLFEAVSHIELGAMPLPAYKLLHPESVVTPQQLTVLKNYLRDAVSKGSEPATAAEDSAANEQYEKWIQSPGAAPAVSVAAAPNGFAFLPEYKNWRAISSTDRFDNHTIRQVLGNDIAIKAIAENHINPWPDGTAFAKVAWLQQRDETGVVHAGAFFQVEFMLRDSKKYADTLGWGWGRWRGVDLKPYGKDATFASECVECHKPLRNTDYVFTEPIRGQE